MKTLFEYAWDIFKDPKCKNIKFEAQGKTIRFSNLMDNSSLIINEDYILYLKGSISKLMNTSNHTDSFVCRIVGILMNIHQDESIGGPNFVLENYFRELINATHK